MSQKQKQILTFSHIEYPTISNLIDEIQFKNKPRKKKTSQTDSLSSATSLQSKQHSKIWTQQQQQMFDILLKKYGTDFSILNIFFPKKTKNQIKNKYKQKHKQIKKIIKKQQNAKFQAVKHLFKEALQHEEDN